MDDYYVAPGDEHWLGEPGECEPPADQLGPEVPDWLVYGIGGIVLLLAVCGVLAIVRAVAS
jgi:hypothetical protein